MAAKGSAKKLVEIAQSQLGIVEGPKENETKYGKFAKSDLQPWCGAFVNWCGAQAGVKIPNTVYTPGGAAAFKAAKAWFPAKGNTPKPGDILYFDFPGDGVDRISHVGICVRDNGDGTCVTIEGNTSGDPKKSQRNGGEVAQKIRGYAPNKRKELVSIVGWGRPVFVPDDYAPPVAKQLAGVGLAAAVAIGGGTAANDKPKDKPKAPITESVVETSTVTVTPVVFPATLTWVDATGKTITVVLQLPNDTKASK